MRLPASDRLSNIELLRVIAMLMVLTLHTGMIVNASYVSEHLVDRPVAAGFISLMQSSCIIAVNLFVLVSGYFRIKTTGRKLLRFCYLCLFYGFGIYFLLYLLHNLWGIGPYVNGLKMIGMLAPGEGYWFAKCYIILMIIAPLLNKFIEHVSVRTLALFVAGYSIFQFLTNGLFSTSYAWDFVEGFSAYSFIGIYLAGALLQRLGGEITVSNRRCAWLYVGLTVFVTVLLVREISIEDSNLARALQYNSPWVILMAVIFFIPFTRFRFTSRAVNFLAASAFAVYLIHEHPLLQPMYRSFFHHFWQKYPCWIYPLVQLAVFPAIYLGSVLIDQVRIYSWKWIDRRIDFDSLFRRRLYPLVLRAGRALLAPRR